MIFVKARNIFFIVLLIIVADQALKVWVKTHMPLSHSWDMYYHTPATPYDNGIKVWETNFKSTL